MKSYILYFVSGSWQNHNILYNKPCTNRMKRRNPKEEYPMMIIKRNGAEVVFDIEKIIMAVTKANEAADEKRDILRI